MGYEIADRRLTGNLYKSYRKCGKINCHCSTAKNYKHSHPMFHLQYSKRVNGKWKRQNIYVKKSQVKSLRAKIKYAKTRDRARKKDYNLFTSKIIPIIKHLENNPFDDEAWQSLNQLKSEIPKPEKLIVTWQQHMAMIICFIKLTNALQPYLDFILAELAKIEELHNDILGNLRFLREHDYEPTIDFSV